MVYKYIIVQSVAHFILSIYLSDSRLRARINSSYRKRFASLDDAESHFGLSLCDSLAELVIKNRKAKPTKPCEAVNVESDTCINKQAPLQSEMLLHESPQAELPPPELPPLELPQPELPQALPTMESVLKLACCLENSDLEERTTRTIFCINLH
jgi:hypothetical protein